MTVEKVAIVSGAASGIGRATALQLAAKGYHVGVLGRTRSELDETCDLISTAGGGSSVIVADISDGAEMYQAVGNFVASKGRLDAVVTNAGINGVWATIDDLKPDEWNKTIAVNLTAVYLTIHHCVPHLKASGGGSIVVVSSINGTRMFTTPGRRPTPPPRQRRLPW